MAFRHGWRCLYIIQTSIYDISRSICTIHNSPTSLKSAICMWVGAWHTAQLFSIVALQFPDCSQRSFCALLQISLAVYMVINVRLHFASFPKRKLIFLAASMELGDSGGIGFCCCSLPVPHKSHSGALFSASADIFCIIVKRWTGQWSDASSYHPVTRKTLPGLKANVGKALSTVW